MIRQARFQDARNIIGIIGIVGDGSEGTRVYVLDPEASRYGRRSLIKDNPWLYSQGDCLTEAVISITDYRRLLQTQRIEGFFDPGMRLYWTFDPLANDKSGSQQLWRGLVQSYEHELAMDERRIKHSARWEATLTISATETGI